MLNYDLGLDNGQCTFKIEQVSDPDTDKKITVGGHACLDYGLNLQLFMRIDDWDEKLQKQFRYEDEVTGEVRENDLE